MYNAQRTNVSHCIARSTGRPQTAPFKLNSKNDAAGLQCVISLYNESTKSSTKQCRSLNLLFPPVRSALPPAALALAGDYICFLQTWQGKKLQI